MRTKINLPIRIAVILITFFATVLPTQAELVGTKPDHLTIALLQSSNDQQYMKPIQKWFLKIYTEALRRMNITLEYRVLPPKRASINSDLGILDGELSRVFDYNTEHPNLIRVEEHHLISVFSAFATDPTISLNGWQSLNNTNYRIDYRRGIKKCSEKLTTIIPSRNLSTVSSIQGGIGKVLTRRTDIFIEPEDGVYDFLKSNEFKRMNQDNTIEIYKVGVMESITSHFWLHKKHQQLAPALSTILHNMKENGLFDLYLEQEGLNPQLIKW